MRARLLVLPMLLASGIAGAQSDPPQPGEPAEIRTAPPAETAPAPSTESPALARIRAAGGASLADLWELALGADEEAAIAQERARQAEERYRQARAELFPEITLQATAFQQNEVGAQGSGVVSTEPSRQEVRIRLLQTVTRFGAEFAGLREAKQLTEAARAIRDDADRLLYVDLARAYFGILSRERETTIREGALEALRERGREMDARREVGLARRAEVLASATQLAAQEASAVQARNAAALARQDLELILGLPRTVPLLDPVAPGANQAALDADAMVAGARGNRADLSAARLALEAAESHVRLMRAGHLPRLDLAGNYYLERRNFSFFQEQTDYDVTLTFTLPLFEGGAVRARRREAESRARELALVLRRLEERAEADVRAAVLEYEHARALLDQRQAALALAQENWELTREEYREGVGTNLEFLVAESQYLEARLELERQRLAVALARVLAQAAAGAIPGTTGGRSDDDDD